MLNWRLWGDPQAGAPCSIRTWDTLPVPEGPSQGKGMWVHLTHTQDAQEQGLEGREHPAVPTVTRSKTQVPLGARLASSLGAQPGSRESGGCQGLHDSSGHLRRAPEVARRRKVSQMALPPEGLQMGLSHLGPPPGSAWTHPVLWSRAYSQGPGRVPGTADLLGSWCPGEGPGGSGLSSQGRGSYSSPLLQAKS